MLRTVRAKLIALVLTSTLTSGLSAVVVGWMLWREIEETSREGVELARVGITHGVEDDIGGLFVTARALATCCVGALATGASCRASRWSTSSACSWTRSRTSTCG